MVEACDVSGFYHDRYACYFITIVNQPLFHSSTLYYHNSPSFMNINIEKHQSVLSRIGVTEPYLALDNIVGNDRSTAAQFQTQYPIGMESDNISAAEIGRHLAILGAIDSAKHQDSDRQCVYLATSAQLSRLTDESIPTNQFFATATSQLISRHVAHAQCVAANDAGLSFYRLTISYRIMVMTTFKKLFAGHCVHTHSNRTFQLPQLDAICIDKDRITSSIHRVQPVHCMGHFIDIPALPIAVMMYLLSQNAGLLLRKIRQEACSYHVISADIQAFRLAFAGDRIDLSACIVSKQDRQHTFKCQAFCGQTACATMMLLLQSKTFITPGTVAVSWQSDQLHK